MTTWNLQALTLSLLFTVSLFSEAAEFDWAPFDRALKEHVKPASVDGIPVNQVDYIAIQKSNLIPTLSKRLAEYTPVFNDQEQKLAFYINAYNFFAIKTVLDNYPLDSIRDAGNFVFPVWKKTAGTIGNQSTSLHEIEHEILRKLGEPRIHFAIVCASLSCPDLRTEVYSAQKLDTQLHEQTQTFLSQSKGLQLKGNTAHISKIFKWFEEDFDSSGGVIAFIADYHSDVENTAELKYIDYDWRLNRQ